MIYAMVHLMIFLFAVFITLGPYLSPPFPFSRVTWPKPLLLLLLPWKWCQQFLWNICSNLPPLNETPEDALTSLDIQIFLPPKYLSSQKSDSLGKWSNKPLGEITGLLGSKYSHAICQVHPDISIFFLSPKKLRGRNSIESRLFRSKSFLIHH